MVRQWVLPPHRRAVQLPAACPRSDGYFDFYVPDGYGDWLYDFSGGQDVYGCITAFNNVGGFGSSCFPDPALLVIGGSPGSPTGNAVGDAIMDGLNNHVIDNAVQPICIYLIDGTCFT